MSEIATLFAGLNVALGAMDRDAPTGMQRLMNVQGRAASVAALRQAPLVVVQIVEDVLAQTGAAQADLMTNPLTRAWQAEVLGACRGAIEGRFPFAAGPDADPAAVLRLLGPGGVADRFIKGRAAAHLDMTTQPWRWKPEARFAGLSPESAELLQRLAALSDLFASGAETRLTFSALAERGAATIAIGGAGGPVETRSAPLSLTWPGPDPARGVEVSFRTPQGEARLAEAGPWGLLRLLGPLRLRERDEGKRFLVDLRTQGARLFVEIEVDRPANLLSRRMLMRDLTCAQVL
jgi:type VI protein secretion system component VasK